MDIGFLPTHVDYDFKQILKTSQNLRLRYLLVLVKELIYHPLGRALNTQITPKYVNASVHSLILFPKNRKRSSKNDKQQLVCCETMPL